MAHVRAPVTPCRGCWAIFPSVMILVGSKGSWAPSIANFGTTVRVKPLPVTVMEIVSCLLFLWKWRTFLIFAAFSAVGNTLLFIIIIMYIYHAVLNALSAHMVHINLNMIFYTHVEHSPTKTIYIQYYTKNKKNKKTTTTHYKHTHTRTHARTHARTHTHTHTHTHTKTRTHARTHARTHTHTHTHTNTHKHTNTLTVAETGYWY